MRILIVISHPAHVHLFKNAIANWTERGHNIMIAIRENGIIGQLLDEYGLDYEALGQHKRGLVNKAAAMVAVDYKLYKIAKRFDPDMLAGVGSMYAAHVSTLLHKPCILFEDTEHSRIQYWLYKPFTKVILTPSAFRLDLGPKHIRYNGFHELAYLHPNYFAPEAGVLDELGLKEDGFIILRFVSWEASHDVGKTGMSHEDRMKLIGKLSKFGKVLISSEEKLEGDLEKYAICTSPEKMHSLLYYAKMYIGEGATMAAESAILGTPSIFVSELAGTMGNFSELGRYSLVHSYKALDAACEKAVELLGDKDLKGKSRKNSEKLISEKIDVTEFMTDFIEGYPKSKRELEGGQR